jgi:hypothetical protein
MIKLVLLDIDGVLTDGKVTVDAAGRESKTLDYRDIDAIFELKRQGIPVGFLTGEATSPASSGSGSRRTSSAPGARTNSRRCGRSCGRRACQPTRSVTWGTARATSP